MGSSHISGFYEREIAQCRSSQIEFSSRNRNECYNEQGILKGYGARHHAPASVPRLERVGDGKYCVETQVIGYDVPEWKSPGQNKGQWKREWCRRMECQKFSCKRVGCAT